MTYGKYAEKFLSITEDEFNKVMDMFPQVEENPELLKYCDEDTDKETMIAEIVQNGVDPVGNYIDDIEFFDDTLDVWEHLDLEELDSWRQKLLDFVSSAHIKVEFHA